MAVLPFRRMHQDLNWILSSPPLFSHQLYLRENSPWNSSVIADFLDQPIDSGLLSGWLAGPKNYRLGNYVEQLLHFYLSHTPKVKDVIRSVALRQEGRTLGELDFVYRGTSTVPYTHLEVAVKFYMSMGAANNAQEWIGIDPSDNLGAKLNRLLEHQLPIALQTQSEAILNRLDIQIGHSEAFVKGRLFYPWKDFQKGLFEYPESVAAEHLKGWWARLAEVDQLNDNGMQFYPLDKNYWLAKLTEQEIASLSPLYWENGLGLIHPMMVARVNRYGREVDRGIILPDLWPGKRR